MAVELSMKKLEEKELQELAGYLEAIEKKRQQLTEAFYTKRTKSFTVCWLINQATKCFHR